MTQKLKISSQELVRQAEREIETLSPEDAYRVASDPNTMLVDLRDIRELNRQGRIPGAVHCPRGMLEFWIDPESPYHRQEFADNERFIFFCAAGWRSALATKAVQDMGMSDVAHISGGFEAWNSAGYPVEAPEPKPAPRDTHSDAAAKSA